MGLAKVSDHDRPVYGGHDLAEGQLFRWPGQHVTSAHAPLGTHDARPLQSKQDLLEVGLGKPVRSAMSRTEVGWSPPCNARDSSARQA